MGNKKIISVIYKNPDDYNNIYIFGDIHGNFKRFSNLLDKLTLSEKDLLVFLGDYIDRSRNNLDVIRKIWDLEKNYDVVALRGNHEDMCIKHIMKYGVSYENRNTCSDWIYNGGKYTYTELIKLEDKNEQAEFIEWIASRHLLLKLGENIRASHAGFNAFGADFEQKLEAVNGDIESISYEILWSRGDFLRYYNGKERWYVGHTPVQSASEEVRGAGGSHKPIFLKNNIVMMDTGSFLPKGSISCINIRDNTICQSDI